MDWAGENEFGIGSDWLLKKKKKRLRIGSSHIISSSELLGYSEMKDSRLTVRAIYGIGIQFFVLPRNENVGRVGISRLMPGMWLRMYEGHFVMIRRLTD